MWSYLWQNFLIDSKIRNYIAEHIAKIYQELWCEALIEIGPGKGSITKLIDAISDNFFVIEKDVSLIEDGKLKIEHGTLIQGDVLEVDVDKLLQDKKLDSKKTLVVWNLPYYITSPILRKFFWNGEQKYAGGIFMLQDEVGQKLRGDAKKKSYLWRLINYAYQVNYLKWVPAKCFKPAPKVKSCLVELKIKNWKFNIERERLIHFLEMYAPFSRKTLGAIEKIAEKQQLKENSTKSKKIEKNRTKSSKVEESWGNLWKKISTFVIPGNLKKKRLEELDFDELSQIVYS